MYQYVNKVNVAANLEKDEIAIDFIQAYPEFSNERISEDGSPAIDATYLRDSVAKIIVTKEFAGELMALLQKMLQ